ncbi:MAG: dynamin family protein [Pseudomonadota bacterium]
MLENEPDLKQHAEGFSELNGLWEQLDQIENALETYRETAFAFVEDPIDRAVDKIKAFEPAVSVIGQVKAGKSTLLNALIGQTSLLPSDVNPWTSVITNVHLNSRIAPPDTKALFRFFDADEWDRLVETGGRLGEIASRAGFEHEAGEVRTQVNAMRQTTEERLGDEFEKLLAQSHAFPTLEQDVIDRYICYGDPEELEEGATEGVYADITKLADLYVDLPQLPKGLCLRDTPGVNDTFMMREQITLNAISESRVCVVVLSAHQALSTMDVALMRIICSVEAREVLIFVNRIDELEDPKGEIERIGDTIRRTLKRMGLGDTFEILFGSGYWANMAIDNKADDMMPASRASLEAFYAAGDEEVDLDDLAILREKAIEASGVPALHRAIAARVVNGPGAALLEDVRAETNEIIRMSDMVFKLAEASGGGDEIDRDALTAKFDALGARIKDGFDAEAEHIRNSLQRRLELAQDSFITSAVDALQSHIDAFGEADNWSHEPVSLRLMMKSAYNVCCNKLKRVGQVGFEQVLDGTLDILQFELDFYSELHTTDFPSQPVHKAPTGLAMTLSLDLEASWWRRFWKRGRKNAAETRYKHLIVAETTPLIEMMLQEYFDPARDETWSIISRYLEDQKGFIDAMIDACTTGEMPKRNLDILAAE